jgi:hypothetical protein
MFCDFFDIVGVKLLNRGSERAARITSQRNAAQWLLAACNQNGYLSADL